MLAPITRGAELPAAEWAVRFIWGGFLWWGRPPRHNKRFSSSRDRWYSHRSIKDATCSWRGCSLNFLWARKKKASTNACRHIPVDKEMLSESSWHPKDVQPQSTTTSNSQACLLTIPPSRKRKHHTRPAYRGPSMLRHLLLNGPRK